MLRQLGKFFDAYLLRDIDRPLALEWRTWRVQKVSPSTVNREDEVLKDVLGSSCPRYLAENPLAGLPVLRTPDVETRILTPDEEFAILRVADPIDRAAVLCGLDALMRRGSVINLQRENNHGTYLTLLNAKTGTYKVPLSRRLTLALNEISGSSARYFETFWPQAENNLSRAFERLCRAAGVCHGRAAGGVTFHSLRHTGASRMLAAGVDIKTVMLIGGWRDLKVLNRYLHPTDDAKRAAVETIGSGLARSVHVY